MEVKQKRRRKDYEKNIIKVVKSVIKDPTKTQREIAKETGIGLGNVNRKLNEIQNEQRYKDLIENYNNSIRVLSDDFKKEISDELLHKYIIKVWWKDKAMKLLEEYLMIYIWEKELSKINNNTRYSVLYNAWFKCQACWAKPNKDNDIILEIDHILPRSKWWLNDISNLQVLCWLCNRSKSNIYNFNHNNEI